MRLFLNGVKVIDAWKDQIAASYSYSTILTAGSLYDIEVHYYERIGMAVCRLQLELSGPINGDDPAEPVVSVHARLAGIKNSVGLGITRLTFVGAQLAGEQAALPS